MSEIKIQKAIRKNWFIIGILSLPSIVAVLFSFVSNIRRDTTYNYFVHIKSNEPQYIMLIEFTPQSDFDGKPLLLSSPSNSHYDIYTEKQGYIKYDNYSFRSKGDLQYYSISEQKIYDATPPAYICDEIEKKIHSRFEWNRNTSVDLTILPKGDVDIRVTEEERNNKDILLYESTYQAQCYQLDILSKQLQQYSPVPINEWAELLTEQYFWTLDKQSLEKIGKWKVESVIYHYFSDNALSGSDKYEGTTKLLPYMIWTDNQQIILDMENVRTTFIQVYENCKPTEPSQIHITFNDSLNIESLYLIKDGCKATLKYTVEGRK